MIGEIEIISCDPGTVIEYEGRKLQVKDGTMAIAHGRIYMSHKDYDGLKFSPKVKDR